jgi:hypothetical protein
MSHRKSRGEKRTIVWRQEQPEAGLHKLSTKVVRENPDAAFVFEDLKGIRKAG